ncbi:MAG: rhamnogalacturonan acetylesterase [Caulobacterales bacterium]
MLAAPRHLAAPSRRRILVLAATMGAMGCGGLSGASWRLRPADSRLFIAGDSTASAYGPERYPRMGWGMVFGCGLAPGVRLDNRAASGRSTKSFIKEGRWAALLRDLSPGDAVLIQFGHNDAKREDPSRFTAADGAFSDNLNRFLDDVARADAEAILLTPVARRRFAEGRAIDSHGAYGEAVRAVARGSGAPLVDLLQASLALLDAIGEEASRAYFLHPGVTAGLAEAPDMTPDDTHFSEAGARAIAGLVAQGLSTSQTRAAAWVDPLVQGYDPSLRLGGPGCETSATIEGNAS